MSSLFYGAGTSLEELAKANSPIPPIRWAGDTWHGPSNNRNYYIANYSVNGAGTLQDPFRGEEFMFDSDPNTF